MPPAPKPTARPLKPRRHIKRSPIKRRATTRTTKTKCASRGCTKPVQHIARCRVHADIYLLKLRRALVVKDRCEVVDWHEPGGPLGLSAFRCSEILQDNHGFDRDYKRGNLRWDPENGLSGCAAANLYARYHREEWHDYLRRKWGLEKYERLRELSVRGPMPDYEEAERMLTERMLIARSGQKEEGL